MPRGADPLAGRHCERSRRVRVRVRVRGRGPCEKKVGIGDSNGTATALRWPQDGGGGGAKPMNDWEMTRLGWRVGEPAASPFPFCTPSLCGR